MLMQVISRNQADYLISYVLCEISILHLITNDTLKPRLGRVYRIYYPVCTYISPRGHADDFIIIEYLWFYVLINLLFPLYLNKNFNFANISSSSTLRITSTIDNFTILVSLLEMMEFDWVHKNSTFFGWNFLEFDFSRFTRIK